MDLDERLRACGGALGEPDPAVTDRAWAAVRGGLAREAPTSRRRRHRSRRGLLVAAAALAVAGGAGAVAVTTAVLDSANPPGSVMRVTGGTARAAIDADPILSRAPWIRQHGARPRVQEVDPLPSLVFPAGVDYPAALQSLYTSVAATGRLPAGTALGPPLAPGRVVELPTDPTRGVALDLRAPFGYALPGGQVLPPSYSLPGTLTPAQVRQRLRDADAQGLALPEGAIVDPTQLRPCMIAGPDAPPPCALASG